ncbi:MAG: superoxide dismutase family protein [Oscillospiraceae bacterium]|nr:superoxide dismutase family protein [Oscillospiraceae bacterium]
MNEKMDRARAKLRGDGIFGFAEFSEALDGVLVTVSVRGLPENDTGFFALHIHEGSSCAGERFSQTGGHYNPKKVPHPRHAGDLPPLMGCRGRAYLSVLTDRFELKDVINKTLVIHSQADDFHTQPAGNAGEKIACGVVEGL